MNRYLSGADLAGALGLTRSAISVVRSRAGNAFPSPDVWVGVHPGWSPDRIEEIRDWMNARPGRGSGAGRPRRT